MIKVVRIKDRFTPAQNFIRGALLAALVVLIDQWSKTEVYTYFKQTMDMPAVKVMPFLNIVLVWNTGISFGMLANGGAWTPMLLTLLAIILLAVLIAWLVRVQDTPSLWALGLIIGGAIGNVIDRVTYGAVVDFLDFFIADYHWPAFNVADSAIFIGVVILVWQSIFSNDQPLKGI